MVAIEWKMFGGNGLRSDYLDCLAYLEMTKKRKYRGWLFLDRRVLPMVVGAGQKK